MTFREAAKACGYLSIFVPPALLAWGACERHAWLAFVGVFVAAPLLRGLIGDSTEQPEDWSEMAATVLEYLPVAYVPAFAFCLAITLHEVGKAGLSTSEWTGMGASLYAVCVLASCVAHELLHRRSATLRAIGQVLSGIIGYPVLLIDHRYHHWLGNCMAMAEAPYLDETVWAFGLRRLRAVARRSANLLRSDQARDACSLALSLSATGVSALLCWVFSGVGALLMYLCTCALVAWSMQIFTYLQHWGLGTTDLQSSNLGWEDRCL